MLHYRLLGPLEVVDADGRRVDIGGRHPDTRLWACLTGDTRSQTLVGTGGTY